MNSLARFSFSFLVVLPFSLLVTLSFISGAFAQQTEKPRLILIGDSTVKNGQGRGDGGLWGWGQVIAEQFDTSRIDIENHAIGGRSSRTFLTENRWDRALERLRKGDFVIIQFGHNDGGERFKGDRPRASLKGNGDESERGVVEATGIAEEVRSYGWYLRQYIAGAKARGATPIVCSLVPRDRWEDGRVIRSDKDYGKWAAEAARDGGALFIDLNDIVAKRYEQIGEKIVGEKYFTEKDWTHTTKAGAELTAECVAEAIQELKDCSLASYLLPKSRGSTKQGPRKFSFSQNVPDSFTRVTASDKYTAHMGYGFEPLSEIQSIPEGCTSEKPFYFSAAVLEGNYRVRVTFTPNDNPEPGTVKAELRRLMILNRPLSATQPTVCEFTVNVRTPTIAGDSSVSLKPREKTTEAWAWDEKLTFEINGENACLSALEIEPEPQAVTVFLAGDSTVTDQPLEPWNSWGQMLPLFFKPGVAIANHAQSGESIRSSLGANRFAKIYSLLKPGDYIFIQFGHNDMKDKSSGAVEVYRANLMKVVEEIRALKALPVLVTSMERKQGIAAPTLAGYPQVVREVASQLDVPLVDLNAMSLVLYEALGENLDRAFQDGTHHTNYGSYLFAKCVVQSIRDLKLDLAQHIVDDFPGFDPHQPDAFETVNIPASPNSDLTKPAGS